MIILNAAFDKYLRGGANALTAEQKEGLRALHRYGLCRLSFGHQYWWYAPFEVVERPGADILPPNDTGRFAVTKTVSDEYVFRVPPLRNVELTPPSTPAWPYSA